MNKKLIPILLILVVFLTSGFGCKIADKATQEAMKPVSLTYWRVYDGPDAFDEIIAKYKQLHPFVSINYRKLRYNEYEKELLDAMAEDRGPDIFSIQNTWVRGYQNKIKPMPDTITMAYPIEKGTIKKEIIPELRTNKSLSLKEIKNNFVDVVYGDVVVAAKDQKTGETKNLVYGLPLSVDTLALFFNKDLMNNAGIAEAPGYWNKDFQQYVKKLTKQDATGTIAQAGIAFGGSANIERSTDALSVLMMQNGSEMMLDDGKIVFNQMPSAFQGQEYNPGLEALRFYADFANPAKEVYCWNAKLDNSLKMFTEGKLAFMLGYSYHLAAIKAEAPKLNFGVAKLPQIEGNVPVNFANYWVETVSAKSKNPNEAWDFVQFAAKAEQAKLYLDKTKRPTALRSLIEAQLNDADVNIFTEQVLTAKSWYKGADALAAESIINEMIDTTVGGQGEIEEIINLAAQKVQQTVAAKKNNN